MWPTSQRHTPRRSLRRRTSRCQRTWKMCQTTSLALPKRLSPRTGVAAGNSPLSLSTSCSDSTGMIIGRSGSLNRSRSSSLMCSSLIICQKISITKIWTRSWKRSRSSQKVLKTCRSCSTRSNSCCQTPAIKWVPSPASKATLSTFATTSDRLSTSSSFWPRDYLDMPLRCATRHLLASIPSTTKPYSLLRKMRPIAK